MKIYLSGPMTGLPDFNRPNFLAAATMLRAQGHEVINPGELDEGDEVTHAEYLKRDIDILINGGIDALVLLAGWLHSKGAVTEVIVARATGIPVLGLYNGQLLTVAFGSVLSLEIGQTLDRILVTPT